MKTSLLCALAHALAGTVLFAISAPASAQEAAPPLPGVNEATGEVEFSNAGKAFTMPAPKGYCTPEGADMVRAARVAAGDSANFTLVQLDLCGTAGVQYVHVKTPRAMPVIPLARNVFLTAIADEFQTGNALEQGSRLANDDLSDLTDRGVSVDFANFGYSGRDEDCVYLSGFMKVNLAGADTKVAAATCITLTASRMFSVNAYDFTDNPPPFDDMRESVRVMAMSIRED